MGDASDCTECGHSKSDHMNDKCKYQTCTCKKFQEKKTKKIDGDDERVQPEVDIDKIFQEFQGTRKSQKKKPIKSKMWDDKEKHRERIRDAPYDEHEYKIHESEEIIKKDPEDVEAWLERGIALRRLGKAEQALVCFETALLFDKKNVLVLGQLGSTYEKLGRDRDAIKCYEDALNIDEDNIGVLNAIAYVHQGFDEYDDSMKYYFKVLKIDDRDLLAIDNIGFNYKRQKKFDDAIKFFKRSLALEDRPPNDHFAKRGLAETYWFKDDVKNTKEIIEQLIKDDAADYHTWFIRGRLAADDEKYDDAIKFFKRSLKLNGSFAHTYFNLGKCCLETESYDLGILYYKQGFSESDGESNRALWLNGLGICYKKNKEYENALDSFDSALLFDPKNLFAMREKMDTLSELKRYNDVVEVYETHPEFHDDVGVKARVRDALGEAEIWSDALKYADEVVVMEKSTHNYVWRGFLLAELGRFPDAEESYDEAIKIDPEYPDAYKWIGELFFKQKEYEKAKNNFHKAWELSKTDLFLFREGVATKELGHVENRSTDRYNEALDIFKEIIKNDVKNADAYNEIGNCEWNLKNYTKAEKSYLQACKLDPINAEIWSNLGDVVLKRKSKKEALMFFTQALLHDKTHVASLIGKAQTLTDLEKYSEVHQVLKTVLEINENNTAAMFEKARCFGYEGKYEESIRWYKKFIELSAEPSSSGHIDLDPAWTNIAWCENHRGNFDDALDAVAEALKINEKSYGAFREKTKAYEKKKDYPKAISTLEMHLNVEPESSEFLMEEITRICKKSGDKVKQEEYENKLRNLDDQI